MLGSGCARTEVAIPDDMGDAESDTVVLDREVTIYGPIVDRYVGV